MQYGNYAWHSEGITMRYDFFVHVMIDTPNISMCTRRSVAVLIEQIYLICQVYSSLNSNGIH